MASPSASDPEPAASALASRVAKEGLVLRPDFLLLTDATLSSRRRLLRGRSETVSSPSFLHFLGTSNNRQPLMVAWVPRGCGTTLPTSLIDAEEAGGAIEVKAPSFGSPGNLILLANEVFPYCRRPV